MMYPPNAFSKNDKPTIEALDPKIKLTYNKNLSDIDIREIQKLYKCTFQLYQQNFEYNF